MPDVDQVERSVLCTLMSGVVHCKFENWQQGILPRIHIKPKHVLQHYVHSFRLPVRCWVMRRRLRMYHANSFANSISELVTELSPLVRYALRRHAMGFEDMLHKQIRDRFSIGLIVVARDKVCHLR